MIFDVIKSARFQAATATATVTGELIRSTPNSNIGGLAGGALSIDRVLNTTVLTTGSKSFADLAGTTALVDTVIGAIITFTTAVKISFGTSPTSTDTVLAAGTYRFGWMARNGCYELEKLYDTTVLTYGADTVNGLLKVEQRYSTVIVSADGLIKSGAGFLDCFTVTQTSSSAVTAGVLTLYDNTAESGTVLWGPAYFSTAQLNPIPIPVHAPFTTGCYAGYATLAGVTVIASIR